MENKVLTYFKGDELAAEVFLSKYSLNKMEHPIQMFQRLANEFHLVECRSKKLRNRTWKKLSPYGQNRFAVQKDYNYFYNLFRNFNKIIPGGSILANLGNPSLGSTSNCYYIDLKDDSTEAIFQLCSEMSSIYKYRGGVGIDISKLRPRGAAVHNNAKTSSGSVSFMPLFSKVTSTIAQEGRRGALMISILVDHPDVLEFITCKEDLTKITAANISVKITKEFTKALTNNQEYFTLKWCKDTLTNDDLIVFEHINQNIPYTPNHPLYVVNVNGKEVYVKIVRTRDLFHRLVEANHKSAEPGILLWDNITDYSLSSYYPQYRELGTNPCVTPDTTILTKTGFVTIGSVVGQEIEVWNGHEWTIVRPFKTSDSEKIYLVTFSDGSSLKCTDYHEFIMKDSSRQKLRDCNIGDKLAKFSYPNITISETVSEYELKKWYTLGFFSGDGTIAKEDERTTRYFIDLYGEKQRLIDYLSVTKYGNIDEANNKLRTMLTFVPTTNKTYVPINILNKTSKLNWLAGIIDSDGTLNDVGGSIAISSIDEQFLLDIKSLLITLGIPSIVGISKDACVKNIKGIDYSCKICYRLVISASNVEKLAIMGLPLHRVSLNSHPNRSIQRNISITGITEFGNSDTYCLTDIKNHSCLFNHVMTGQCGEIPLGDKDACRLFAINLSTIDSGDMDEVYSRAYEQVILADYLVDLEETKIDQILTKINNPKSIEYQLWSTIKNTAKKGRRIGCGLTGLFDYLVKSKYNIKDNPSYVLDIAEMLMRTKMKAELDATVDLAIMKGSFVGYTNKESSKLIDFIKEEFPLQYKKMCKYGRRNVSLSTVAPTGSISILAGCTSGIEPLFAPYYKRKRKVNNDTSKQAVKDVDGENFEVYTVFHRKLYEWAEVNNIKGTPEEIYRESPYYKVCADDLDYKFRLDLQSIVQRYTTHSISSTINLPEHTSVEDIKDIYQYAMKAHLKGCTIYRAFSRSGILVKDTSNEVKFNQYDAPSRPKNLQAESFISKSKGITYAVIVGLLDGKPYEIFAAISPPGFKSQKGEIIKVKKGVYRWVGADGDVLENLNSLSESSLEKITTLYISMLLRTGAKLPFVIKVAKKADGGITSFTSAICRILGKYIPKEEERDTCPECGEKLIHEGGCTKCTQCSYSLCLFTYEIKN